MGTWHVWYAIAGTCSKNTYYKTDIWSFDVAWTNVSQKQKIKLCNPIGFLRVSADRHTWHTYTTGTSCKIKVLPKQTFHYYRDCVIALLKECSNKTTYYLTRQGWTIVLWFLLVVGVKVHILDIIIKYRTSQTVIILVAWDTSSHPKMWKLNIYLKYLCNIALWEGNVHTFRRQIAYQRKYIFIIFQLILIIQLSDMNVALYNIPLF